MEPYCGAEIIPCLLLGETTQYSLVEPLLYPPPLPLVRHFEPETFQNSLVAFSVLRTPRASPVSQICHSCTRQAACRSET